MNVSPIELAITLGVVIATSGGVTLLILRAFGKMTWDAYAYGEASAYRKQADLPPLHADGPPEPIDFEGLTPHYEDDETGAVGDPEPEPSRVRVNISGPRVVKPD